MPPPLALITVVTGLPVSPVSPVSPLVLSVVVLLLLALVLALHPLTPSLLNVVRNFVCRIGDRREQRAKGAEEVG